ncbi:hypothetical protein [Hymenobacter sp. YC55]|uniref:hypothetical protein n=1 Tax=Hymenobacter sp. YC55 TaxID=3034019 RepID=UPI0023F76103|nr:hypothetical protein [Hymenobacter sp. YC55]MDF7815460.1 hypothetical protein [Hymenobacter sp. YC55]
MESISTLSRSWQDQPLPAPLLPAHLAEVLALGLLRQQPATRAAVAVGSDLIQQTLERAGIATTVLQLTGRTGFDMVYQTNPEAADRFDALLSEVVSEPSPVDHTAGGWLRQRTLAVLRLKALSPADTFIQLPEVDAAWQPASEVLAAPRLGRWLAQGLPLLLLAFGLLDVYIWNAGKGPALWPLLVLPLLGALAFGGLLFRRLRTWRLGIAQAWLARPARLRPDSTVVAAQLARAPWALVWWPPVLLVGAFLTVVLLLVASPTPTLPVLLVPVALALLAQVLVSWWRARRYIEDTRELVQGLPPGLLPTTDQQGSLWQSYSYF